MIEVQNLTKRYPTRLAVDDVTFSVQGRGDRRFPRSQRRREDHDDARPDGLPPADAPARRASAGHDVVTPVDAGARLARIPAGVRGHVSRDAGRASTSRTAPASKASPGGPCAARVGRGARPLPPRRGGRPEDREPLQGVPAAHGAGRRARSPAAGLDPRRADDRARPGADHQDPRDDPRARARTARCFSRRTSCRRSRRSATACSSSTGGGSWPRARRRSCAARLAGTPVVRAAFKGSGRGARRRSRGSRASSRSRSSRHAGETRVRISCAPGATRGGRLPPRGEQRLGASRARPRGADARGRVRPPDAPRRGRRLRRAATAEREAGEGPA